MAPAATGVRDIDHVRLIELNMEVLRFADAALKNGGVLVMKSSRGGEGIHPKVSSNIV